MPSNTTDEVAPRKNIKTWRDSAATRAFTHRELRKSRHHPIHAAAKAESRNETATIICAIRRLRSATGLGALGFAFVFALLPSSLEACDQWDVSKSWGLKQSDGNLVQMELRQGYEQNLIAQTAPPSSISGTASYRDKNGLRVGKVKGTVLGNKFNVQVIYSNGSGHWIGTILPSGIIEGTCSDDSVRSYKATFVSERPMVCLPASNFRTKGTLYGTVSKSPPTIEAWYYDVTPPFMVLAWDAGVLHPQAEVWVQVDAQAKTKIAKQIKGNSQLPIEAGGTYVYSLIDAGQTLATQTKTVKFKQ